MKIIYLVKSNIPVILAGFNNAEAQNFLKSYTDPLFSFLLWAAPVIAAISAIALGIAYFCKEEDERDRHKFIKTLKKILAVTIVIESITVIFKIVGITTG